MRKEVLEVVKPLSEEIRKLYGDKLLSIAVYGSSATLHYIPKKSNINLLVILEEINMNDLEKYIKIGRKWMKKGVVVPLFLTKEEIETSSDVFPLEFLDMKERHYILFGEDLLEKIQVEKPNLRRQLEFELKGKLLRLRHIFMEVGAKPREVIRLIVLTITSLIPLIRGILYLLGEDVPSSPEEMIRTLSKKLHLREEIFNEAWQLKKGKELRGERLRNLYTEFHEELEKLTQVVDRLEC